LSEAMALTTLMLASNDIAFTAEEITKAVSSLKLRKAAGPDGLMAEHLSIGGDTLVIWLMNILNSVVELEAVPSFLKIGYLVPVYKSGGKDPFLVNSYRGKTVTSTIAKVLEFLILGRLEAVFSEAGIPHVNQTAYRKKVSCADAILQHRRSLPGM